MGGVVMGAETTSVPARVTDFEGHRITTVVWNGRPAWIAREVGESLGYADGSRLVDKIAGEWKPEFIEGTDFDTLTNGRLAAFKERLPPESGASHEELPTVSVGSRAKALTILYESGLHLALLKTRKPAGQRLRRMLATEVLPQLVRTGGYAPAPELAPAPAPVPALPIPSGMPDAEVWMWRQILTLAMDGDERWIAARLAEGAILAGPTRAALESMRDALSWCEAAERATNDVASEPEGSRKDFAAGVARALWLWADSASRRDDPVFHFSVFFTFHNDVSTMVRSLRLAQPAKLIERGEQCVALRAAIHTLEAILMHAPKTLPAVASR